MLEFFQSLFLSYGYFFLFFGSVLEGIIFTGFFVPGGLLVLLGGYFARANPNDISLIWVIFLSWMGMFIGDLVNYYMGKSLWQRYFSKFRFFDRLASVHFFGEQDRIANLLSKWGLWAIFYAHVVGAMRSVVGFVAGASGFPLRSYIWATLIASFLWSLIFTGVGYFVADATADFTRLNTTITFAAIGILLLILLLRFCASLVITFFTSRYMMRRLVRIKFILGAIETLGIATLLSRLFRFLKRNEEK